MQPRRSAHRRRKGPAGARTSRPCAPNWTNAHGQTLRSVTVATRLDGCHRTGPDGHDVQGAVAARERISVPVLFKMYGRRMFISEAGNKPRHLPQPAGQRGRTGDSGRRAATCASLAAIPRTSRRGAAFRPGCRRGWSTARAGQRVVNLVSTGAVNGTVPARPGIQWAALGRPSSGRWSNGDQAFPGCQHLEKNW